MYGIWQLASSFVPSSELIAGSANCVSFLQKGKFVLIIIIIIGMELS